VDEVRLNAAGHQPPREPKTIPPGLIGNDETFDPSSRRATFDTPTPYEREKMIGIGVQLFQRLAVHARKQASDKPRRLAHLDDHDESAILIEGCRRTTRDKLMQHDGVSTPRKGASLPPWRTPHSIWILAVNRILTIRQ
jgi:hypothetical protein